MGGSGVFGEQRIPGPPPGPDGLIFIDGRERETGPEADPKEEVTDMKKYTKPAVKKVSQVTVLKSFT